MRFFKWFLGIGVSLILSALVFVGVLYLSLPDVSFLKENNPETTAFIELRKGQAKEKRISYKLKWKWVPLEKIPPSLIYTAIYREDTVFWSHSGVAWEHVWIAAKVNWQLNQVRYGASTITQQVARNLFLSPERTAWRKIKEWLLAYKLEAHLDKKRILEIYLNIAEWGKGIFGAEAAANRWFKKSAAELSPREAIRLVMILPSPLKRSAVDKSPQMEFEINAMIAHLGNVGILTDEQVMNFLWLGR